MKKWIILIVIWILALGGIYGYSKTIKFDENIAKPPVKEKEDLSKFEYIDYTGYYNENNLKVEKIKFSENNGSDYIKISGLKDKELEERLNKSFYDEVSSLINEGYHTYSYLECNAFNILSFYVDASVFNKEDSKYTYKYLYHNIDLTTGNEIKMSDILNLADITNILSSGYYNKVVENLSSEYGYNVLDYKNNYKFSLENIDNQELKNSLSKLEDDALEYARNFDYNKEFYITSAGIVIMINYDELKIDNSNTSYKTTLPPILINDYPRLFNYFYKYKTKESIFDGSYTGKKNLMYAEWGLSVPRSVDISDNMVIHRYIGFSYGSHTDESVLETAAFKSHVESLDKNQFYYIDNINYDDSKIWLTQCTMTKEIYNKEYKKYIADRMINRSIFGKNQEGHIDIGTDNVSCGEKYFYINNPNVYLIYQGNDRLLDIKNNQKLATEINSYVKDTIVELSKTGTTYLKDYEVEEKQITVTIHHIDFKTSEPEDITKVFDL